MKIIIHDQIVYAFPDGELNASNVTAFREEMMVALSAPFKCLEINASQLLFIDSSGLGALVALFRFVTSPERGGLFRISSPCREVMEVLEFTRLNQVFDIVNPAV